ncbi:MAG TPA: sigma-70 family RNA polymerase sigma factor [Acidimicrobiales bacterium]|nr:sigma-70 family RNA polymerase sigma factor [Acidimicrobiales bacterium]
MDATAIFREHAVALERLAARITGDREEARDLVADAFAALLAGGPSEARHAVPWLYVTVRHRAYNRMRHQAVAQRRLPALATAVAPLAEPESAVRHDPFIRALVSTATARLTERDRIAVSMRHVEQAPYEEIAAALGTTVTQARVIVHRANNKLRRSVISSLSRRRPAVRDGSPALSEELSSLLQTPVAVPPSWSERVGNAVRRLRCRTQATTGRATVHIGELVAPGIAMVAMATGPGAAIAPAPVPHRTTAMVSAPAFVVPRHEGTPVLALGIGAAAPRGSAFVPTSLDAPPSAMEDLVGSPVRFEDPGRFGTPQPHHVLSRTLGLPRLLLDPLDVSSLPEADIRSLELATLADRWGRPRALRWRLHVEAPLDASAAGFELHWGYERTKCYTLFKWPTTHDPMVLTLCPVAPEPLDVGVIQLWAAFASSPVELRVEGTVLEAILPFESLDEGTRPFLYPGARMVRIVAHTQCPSDDCPAYDSAPDQGGYTYQIER